MTADHGKRVSAVLSEAASAKGIGDTWPELPAIQWAATPPVLTWQLRTVMGDDLGMFPGVMPCDAIRAMIFDIISADKDEQEVMDDLVRVWGGIAIYKGSVPPPASETPDTMRGEQP